MEVGLIHCVLYAAKSTEDRRGSIPDQLEDCRRATGDTADRVIVGEYDDEAFSAYSGDRGPGLIDAMRHVEELAREHGTAELWAQHSDRLARGDGRTARHAVEIALWALKRNIRVRTIQDPDTFRDLLYAVVTGQRNHEDSRRKGLALAAGRRRAVERGEYTGHTADGYRVAVSIEDGQVIRRLEIDPDRQGAIELIFRLGLRGKTSGQIAEALNRAGWRTKPRTQTSDARGRGAPAACSWSCTTRATPASPPPTGRSSGRGSGPPTSPPAQHHRIQRADRQTFARGGANSRTTSRSCSPGSPSAGDADGRCICHTGVAAGRRHLQPPLHLRQPLARPSAAPLRRTRRSTPTSSRRCSPRRCPRCCTTRSRPERAARARPRAFDGHWTEAPERQQLREAALGDDDAQLDLSIERMVARVAPELTIHRQLAATRRQTRQQSLERRVQEWAEANAGDARRRERRAARPSS